MSTRTSPTLESSVCFALYSSMQTTLQLYRELLAPWGLTYQQLMVLAVVWERGEVSPGELAELLCLDASSVSGLVGRLERAGHLRREHSESDRRSVRIGATEHSLAVRGELGHIERCVAEAMKLTPDDAETALDTLRSLRTAMLSYDARSAAASAAER
ncbi:MarR family transcriptional regulator [Microbacterium sp. HD4P20]|uniref:MarR family winged helix-turn-helix transcriptional regulator n=1 Tax=Microbacterium sp. HD4P20 TaxID=2864874 RepID=UPI001C641CE6|nr:MarR family transcriptional regulator [Microbacterium sp. HD4P20]MCP2635212.1 MarR family transcriptional regulator [Microbacterium sp. HD4P20]